MLTEGSTVEQLLVHTNFLTPRQELALAYCLPDMTVQDLLDMPTAQTLANTIEEKACELYAREQAKLPAGKRNSGSLTYEFCNAQISLRDIGTIAHKLLRYVHRMFDPIPTATPGVEFC